eukprot:1771588-Rhodomonas_salina.1
MLCSRITLRLCYAISGTDLAYAAILCYTIPGTDLAYATPLGRIYALSLPLSLLSLSLSLSRSLSLAPSPPLGSAHRCRRSPAPVTTPRHVTPRYGLRQGTRCPVLT